MDVETLYRMVMDGRIEDAKTVIAILMVRSLLAESLPEADR